MLLVDILLENRNNFFPIVEFDPDVESMVEINLTSSNERLNNHVVSDIFLFEQFVENHLAVTEGKYAIGGYLEYRDMYARSEVFDNHSGKEPRRLHLGVDVWGKAGTKIYAPLDAEVHSIAYNESKGDYGATIILMHRLAEVEFYTLYGHLSKRDLSFKKGEKIVAGNLIGHFGTHHENGFWPPHLHFQLIRDMGGKEGDYPGVCSLSDKEFFMQNCPNPDLIVNLNRFLKN